MTSELRLHNLTHVNIGKLYVIIIIKLDMKLPHVGLTRPSLRYRLV